MKNIQKHFFKHPSGPMSTVAKFSLIYLFTFKTMTNSWKKVQLVVVISLRATPRFDDS